MIYTVTFNPSLDYVVDLPELRPGEINRTAAEAIYPGGKGINVSLVLKQLGLPSCMLGFIAGFTGREIERLSALSEKLSASLATAFATGISRGKSFDEVLKGLAAVARRYA